MKNDEHGVNQQPQRSDSENPGASAKPLANNNGQETSESGHNLAAEASGKRTVSSRKVEANRSNARKSTGPKTAAGKLEENWVDKIVVWSWRLRRVIRSESGQIARSLAEHSYDVQRSRAADAEEPGFGPSSNPEIDAMTDHLFFTSEESRLRYEAMINRQLNHALAELERLQAARKQKPVA